jgi:alpha(1,3/1,4) fucosyltransferase
MRVQFLDFWPNFNTNDNVILDHIRRYHNTEVVTRDPELIVCSIFGTASLKINTPKILVIGECVSSEHYTLNQPGLIMVLTTTRINNPIAYHYPWGNWFHRINHIYEQRNPVKTHFCAFVVSNPRAKFRNHLFCAMNKYKRVDSAGSAFNNVGYRAPGAINDSWPHGANRDFINWLSRYKFYICCENQAYPGYHTEKIMNAYLANCVPIYWGAETIKDIHNMDSMIFVRTIEEAVAAVKRLDQNPELYLAKQQANPFLVPLSSSESPYNYEAHGELIRSRLSGLFKEEARESQ